MRLILEEYTVTNITSEFALLEVMTVIRFLWEASNSLIHTASE